MKKLIRVMGLCALVAFAFSSCKKTETKTFTATTAPIENDSKTQLNDNSGIIWELGDAVTFVNRLGEDRVFSVSKVSANGQTATFHVYNDDGEFMDSLDVPFYYRAFYPNANISGDEVRVPIAARQAFAGENFASNTFPMFGWNENGAFSFSTHAGLLYIPFKRADGASDEQATLDSLVLTAKGTELLSGEMAYHYDGSDYYNFVGSGNSITLVCSPSAVVPAGIGNSTTFAFVLPKDVLSGGFFLRGYRGGVKVFEREAAAANGDFECTIVAGKIRKMVSCILPQN